MAWALRMVRSRSIDKSSSTTRTTLGRRGAVAAAADPGAGRDGSADAPGPSVGMSRTVTTTATAASTAAAPWARFVDNLLPPSGGPARVPYRVDVTGPRLVARAG